MAKVEIQLEDEELAFLRVFGALAFQTQDGGDLAVRDGVASRLAEVLIDDVGRRQVFVDHMNSAAAARNAAQASSGGLGFASGQSVILP